MQPHHLVINLTRDQAQQYTSQLLFFTFVRLPCDTPKHANNRSHITYLNNSNVSLTKLFTLFFNYSVTPNQLYLQPLLDAASGQHLQNDLSIINNEAQHIYAFTLRSTSKIQGILKHPTSQYSINQLNENWYIMLRRSDLFK